MPDNVPDNGVYTFVATPEEAAERARVAAGTKDVDVFSAGIGQQLLRAGLVDEVRIHLVPVLLGSGTRLIGDLGGAQVCLERIAAFDSAMATHLRYAVVASS